VIPQIPLGRTRALLKKVIPSEWQSTNDHDFQTSITGKNCVLLEQAWLAGKKRRSTSDR
jgi:hypothetical protein